MPEVVLQFDSENVVYMVAADLVCMTRNRAEAYVVARAVADACKRFPAVAEYSADEVRCIADRVSQRIQRIHMETVRGRVDETDVPQLVDRGAALLNTMWLVCPCHVDMCLIAETVANLFEHGLGKSSCENVCYKRIIGALAEGLVVYLKECMGQRVKVIYEHERDQMDRGRAAMRGQDPWGQERPNSQENVMYL